MNKISKELMGASAVPLVLALLKKSDTYGYEIMQVLKERSSGKINWKEGSLYPVLSKMEKRKLIKSYWNVKDYDRPRKYYSILQKGQKELELLLEERKLISDILSDILNPDN